MPLPDRQADPVGHYAYKLGEAEQTIVELKEALTEAVDVWASYLNCSPNVRSRKRLDEVRVLLERV